MEERKEEKEGRETYSKTSYAGMTSEATTFDFVFRCDQSRGWREEGNRYQINLSLSR